MSMSSAEAQVALDSRQVMLIARALADPKRFELFEMIANAPESPTCTCVKGLLGLSAPTISHHVKDLENAGLIEVKREGKFARLHLRRDVWDAYLQRLSSI